MSSDEFMAMLKTEEAKRAIRQIVIDDLRANGPIRKALIGLYPEEEEANVTPVYSNA